MSEATEDVRIARIDSREGAGRVLAPALGWWSEHPAPGALLGPGAGIGRLTVLRRTLRLRLPDGAAGRVAAGLPGDRLVAVGYGQVLFELAALDSADAVAGSVPTVGARDDLPAGSHAVLAPTDGVFYRRPSPETPAFVEIGQRLRQGQAVGLIEVMKTFNQVLYGGPGLPEEAEVIEIRVTDGSEVHAGDPLLVLR